MSLEEYRPWGYFRVIENDVRWKIKEIRVNPHKRLSLQSHNFREEVWYVIDGTGKAVKGEQILDLKPGVVVKIEKQEIHRIINDSDNLLTLIEIQQGELLEESDIIRYEDDFSRI